MDRSDRWPWPSSTGIVRRQLDRLGVTQQTRPVTPGDIGAFSGAVVMNSWTPGIAVHRVGDTELDVRPDLVGALHAAYAAGSGGPLTANILPRPARLREDGAMGDVIRIDRERTEPEPLWREVLGRRLRTTREDQGRRLVDVATKAGISPQYLSEIERGRKEPSSEMIAAVSGALGIELAHLLGGISADLGRPAARRSAGPMLLAA